MWSRWAWLLAVLVGGQTCIAQQSPAQEPQSGSPSSTAGGPQEPLTLRVNTSVVLVPTLVEKSSGEIIYGLKEKDFSVEDNGVQQSVHVDDDLDAQPVSLVVAVETGRTSLLQFQKISKLGPLLDLFLGEGHGEAAVVTFDSRPELVQDFTPNTDTISEVMHQLQPGDGGAAILDAVGYSASLLEQQPKDRRRVLLLISESRDHGSHRYSAQELVQRIGMSNTLVLSLTYSASKAEFMNDLKGGGQVGPTMNLLSPLMMTIAALHKNVARELAVMSGGEYGPFTRERGFEDSVAEAAKHARNRYILSFRPRDTTPGLHVLRVRLTEDYGARVVARASYWAVSDTGGSSGATSP
jgi:VWFA-related protein